MTEQASTPLRATADVSEQSGLHLTNGTPVSMRPLRVDDRAQLADAYTELSPESRYRRFLSTLPALNERMLQRLVDDVDQDHHVALVLFAHPSGQPEVPIGIGRFIRLQDEPETAEIAITVADDWQGKGAGSILADALTAAAQERGVEAFRAVTLARNLPALGMLRRPGNVVEQTPLGDGVLDVRVRLASDEPERPTSRVRGWWRSTFGRHRRHR